MDIKTISSIGQLRVKDGALYMDDVNLIELTERFGSPLYVFSQKQIKKNVREILDSFQSYHERTSLHYASKAESSLATLQTVKESGGQLEVNSGGEIFKGKKAGFSGKDMVFNGVGKSIKEIESALQEDVKAINIDSEYELERIHEVAGRMHKKANVVIRIVPEISTGVIKGNETGTHESKFGITLDAIEDVIQYALKHTDTIALKGYHYHLGTQTYDVEFWGKAFRVMLGLCIEMYEKTGFQPEILDIGGGLPIAYHIEPTASQYMPPNLYGMYSSDLKTIDIAKAVTKELKPEIIKTWADEKYSDMFVDCELVLEAGRKVVGDAAVLLTRVENYKQRKMLGEDWITVDAGLNTMLEVKTYHWYFPMVCANKMDEPHMHPYKIAGPLCESGDVWYDYDAHKDLPDFRMLPDSIIPGDFIAMLETGAYGTSLMSRYNGRPLAGVIMICEDGKIVEAKKPETYDDLLIGEESLYS